MKKLLLLGGSRYLIPIIKAAHELGIYVITCDYLPDNEGHKYADEYHNISIIDSEAILDLAIELKIDGILSFATDPGVVVAAYVADRLNLPSPPYESVRILQNKDLFRNFLKKNHFNVPYAKGFHNKDEYMKFIEEFSFPVIVKPVDSAGSKGVARVDNKENLGEAIEYALSYSHSQRYIIEEFIEKEGCSSDSDCFSIDNQLVCASFSCQYFDANAANPYTPSAYSWPSDMPINKVNELRNELQRLISLLNLGTSIYNVETRLGKDGKVYIMEVTPRGGGNRLSELIKYASGEDLIANCVKASVGLPLDALHDPVYKGIWAEYIIHSEKKGIFDTLYVDEDFEKKYVIEKDLWIKCGDIVHAFTGANETIGTLIMKFSCQSEMQENLKNINNYVKVIIR